MSLDLVFLLARLHVPGHSLAISHFCRTSPHICSSPVWENVGQCFENCGGLRRGQRARRLSWPFHMRMRAAVAPPPAAVATCSSSTPWWPIFRILPGWTFPGSAPPSSPRPCDTWVNRTYPLPLRRPQLGTHVPSYLLYIPLPSMNWVSSL